MATTKSTRTIKIEDGSYPLVPTASIEIVERPKEGEEHLQLFYNPRDPSNFTPESMAELRRSIRTDGLLEPLVVRALQTRGRVTGIQLLAGERRLRSLNHILSENLYCFSETTPQPARWRTNQIVTYLGEFGVIKSTKGGVIEICLWDENDQPTDEIVSADPADIYPTVAGSKLYAKVPCKVVYNCSDERAMRLAMTENEQQQALTVAEEITVVERLSRTELKQKRIAYMLGTNVTWVSQTASFRQELPPDAFEKLMAGKMTRHVGVKFLSYRATDRQKLYEESVLAEEKDTEAKIRAHQIAMESHEDLADIHEHEADKAEAAGDDSGAKKARKKAASAGKKAETAKKRRDRVAVEAGTLKQSHVEKGAVAAGVKPRKAKMLPRGDVQEAYVTGVAELLGKRKVIDPVCEEEVPQEYLQVVKATAEAILAGDRDPLQVVRGLMVQAGTWTIPDDAVEAPDDEAALEGDEEEYDDGEYDDADAEYDDADAEFDPDDDYDDGYQDMEDYMQGDDPPDDY
jgi:ParB-like chromosome segregation protein Spo0J